MPTPPPLRAEEAQDPRQTPFDYIVVGSGAGGGPLAARLALAGKRVLVLEAGLDPMVTDPKPGDPLDHPDARQPSASWREVAAAPGYHAPSTEDRDISWSFSVRHYDDDKTQQADTKYFPERDPSAGGGKGPGKGGIFYPRTSALGGCTAHHAMIVVKPNDSDWNRIAQRTGDETWRASAMQGYFARIESCKYYREFDGFFRKGLGIFYQALRWVVGLINPRYQHDWGGHGFFGWQPTSFIDPFVILGIARGDRTFKRVLFGVIWFLLRRKGAISVLKQALARLQIVQYLDPNFEGGRGAHGQLAFIPIGTDGKRRTGVREHLLAVADKHPDRLVIATGVLVTRVLFDRPDPQGPPRAVGVAAVPATNLYEASPHSTEAGRAQAPPAVPYFAKREVVLAGGSFNTPQLLMLSGIGEKEHLEEHGIPGPCGLDETKPVAGVVDLPGVGRNLQDRYEVSVVSRTDQPLTTLDKVSFRPGDANDPARRQWAEKGDGLYSTNGGALAIFAKSSSRLQDRPEADPDLFIFGLPAAFRGYYWGYSEELLRATKGAPQDTPNLWTWVILKAYTNNHGGTVRLRSNRAVEQPEICFRSFHEGPDPSGDVAALLDGVQFVREMNARVKAFAHEIQPGSARAKGSADLERWVLNEAWGHHACGTCRIGGDRWQANPADLRDQGAVLDSRFRVHGVSNLRVVDASVFPEIPGYFIVTPIFMIGEKAADVLLEDSERYPQELEAAEAAAVRGRRQVAMPRSPAAAPVAPDAAVRLPADTVGLAFSGGGIRSATFCLGFLQALAARGRLRGVDILSTVSGGGYIGAFLGRLFTRFQGRAVDDKVGRVEEKLAAPSAETGWLRTHANYLSGEGRVDVLTNLAAVWRNLFAVHIFVALLLLAAFTGLRWVSGPAEPRPIQAWGQTWTLAISPWWWLPLLALLGAVVPIWCGFWIAPWPGRSRPHPVVPLLAWMALLGGAVVALRIPGASNVGVIALGVLLLAWVYQEAAQWQLRPGTAPEMHGAIARNRLTRAQATSLVLLAAAAGWFLLDTAARTATARGVVPRAAGVMAALAGLLPFLRPLASKLTAKRKEEGPWAVAGKIAMGAVALALAAFLLFAIDVVAHRVFRAGDTIGHLVFYVTLIVSVALGRATGFANLCSLQQLYGSRLVRTFLGASNESRIGARGFEPPTTVQVADADDDLPLQQYHPEAHGGPLHLINVCVNETVDAASGRPLRQDKGLSMCLGPCGLSVGQRFHSLWEGNGAPPGTVRPLRVSSDPQSFHVLATQQGAVQVEPLRLGQWMAISGAALATGSGRLTSLPLSILLGLLNARLGYWWNSGIAAANRPGRYPPTLWRRIKGLPGWIFRAQGLVLNEWRSYFGGPSQRLWFLSDGGHFENTGLYELLRRRVAFMIAVDAGHDPAYQHDATALLVRRVRQDFGAHFTWMDPPRA
ncbi:MAG TPA: GMC oxidoreductase, partial [Vicinamibacteria bacterium]